MPYYKKDDKSPLGFVEVSEAEIAAIQKSDEVAPPPELVKVTHSSSDEKGDYYWTTDEPSPTFPKEMVTYNQSTAFKVPDPKTLKNSIIEFCNQREKTEQDRQPIKGNQRTENFYTTSIDELKQKLYPKKDYVKSGKVAFQQAITALRNKTQTNIAMNVKIIESVQMPLKKLKRIGHDAFNKENTATTTQKFFIDTRIQIEKAQTISEIRTGINENSPNAIYKKACVDFMSQNYVRTTFISDELTKTFSGEEDNQVKIAACEKALSTLNDHHQKRRQFYQVIESIHSDLVTLELLDALEKQAENATKIEALEEIIQEENTKEADSQPAQRPAKLQKALNDVLIKLNNLKEEKKRDEKFKKDMETADTLEKVKNLADDFFIPKPKPAKTRWNTRFIGAIRKFFGNIVSKILSSKPKVYRYQKLIAEAEVTSKLTEELEKSKTLVDTFQALAKAYQATRESSVLHQYSHLGKHLKDFIFDQFKVRIDTPLQAGKLVELPPKKTDAFHHRIIRLLMAQEDRVGLDALPLVRVKLKPETPQEKEVLLDETVTRIREALLRRIPEGSQKNTAISQSSEAETTKGQRDALKTAAKLHRDTRGVKGFFNRSFDRSPKSLTQYNQAFDAEGNVRQDQSAYQKIDYLGPKKTG